MQVRSRVPMTLKTPLREKVCTYIPMLFPDMSGVGELRKQDWTGIFTHFTLKVECLLTSAIGVMGTRLYIFLNLPFPSNPKISFRKASTTTACSILRGNRTLCCLGGALTCLALVNCANKTGLFNL